MVYGCRCSVFSRLIHLTTSIEMRFFWLPLSTMNYNRDIFTHICEWKICSPSSRSSGSIFWILVVATVALGFTSMIFFPLSFSLLGFDNKLEHAFNSEAFSSATSDCLAQHSIVLWVGLLWNSHHVYVSSFVFVVFLFACNFDNLSWVTLPWLCPLFYGLEVPFPCFRFADLKSCFLYLNFYLNLTMYQ